MVLGLGDGPGNDELGGFDGGFDELGGFEGGLDELGGFGSDCLRATCAQDEVRKGINGLLVRLGLLKSN